jgi:hypothetical protein
MSIVSDIVDALEAKIILTAPTFSKASYGWDTSFNSESKSKKIFSIRPSSASFISGTCRTITIEQTFSVEFCDSFRNKGDKDTDLNEKIMGLYEAHESLYRETMRDNFQIGRVQVVSAFDINEPEIDNDNKICRIVTSFTIRYRTE